MNINLTAYYHRQAKTLQAVEFGVWPIFFHWRVANSQMRMGKARGRFFNLCIKKKTAIRINEVLK